MDKLDIRGRRFVDSAGRHVILRGVNLGGDCKVPYPKGGTNYPTDFSDHRTVSFIGRPFPLAEADEHLSRLKHWGFNCFRLLTTWEAVEHAGPGKLDEAYLDYYAELCRRAGEYGFYVFVDFHQDVWARASGGDGAPNWLFETVGLDFTKFDATGAATIMQRKYDYARGGWQEDRYPTMIWPANYNLPANGIMWTLFFAGRDMAPDLKIEGKNVQDYMQDHYLGAMRAIAERVKDMPHVLGFDSLNEPGEGFIGAPLTRRHTEQTPEHPEPLHGGPALSPLDGLLLMRGVPRIVPFFERDAQFKMRQSKDVTLNPDGVSAWLPGASDPFEKAGAYSAARDKPPVEDFFTHKRGRKLEVGRDYMAPFFGRVADTIRAVRSDWLLFAEVNPFRAFTGGGFPQGTPARTVNATHWYDLPVLLTKRFAPREKAETNDDAALIEAVSKRYTAQIERMSRAAESLGPDAPTLVGEFGMPADVEDASAYKAYAAGDRSYKPWRNHILAFSAMYDAMDKLHLSSTQWCYAAGNRNEPAIGDGWNQEDVSIFSRDQQDNPKDLNSGGRGVPGFARAYARRVQGTITTMRFTLEGAKFRLVFDADPKISAPTQIAVPAVHYPRGAKVEAPGCRIVSNAGGIVEILAESAGEKIVTITPS